MKRLLLDTHAFLWWLMDDARLGVNARNEIANQDNQVFISAISIWEIEIKRALGKLIAQDDLVSAVAEEGFMPLGVTLEHAARAGRLPPIHADPFDRMLIGQALCGDMTIVTQDSEIPKYQSLTLRAKE